MINPLLENPHINFLKRKNKMPHVLSWEKSVHQMRVTIVTDTITSDSHEPTYRLQLRRTIRRTVIGKTEHKRHRSSKDLNMIVIECGDQTKQH